MYLYCTVLCRTHSARFAHNMYCAVPSPPRRHSHNTPCMQKETPSAGGSHSYFTVPHIRSTPLLLWSWHYEYSTVLSSRSVYCREGREDATGSQRRAHCAPRCCATRRHLGMRSLCERVRCAREQSESGSIHAAGRSRRRVGRRRAPRRAHCVCDLRVCGLP